MKLLLDTHALLWWLDGGKRLSRAARSAVEAGENEVFVSAATGWEIALKKSIGKLAAPDDLEAELIRQQFERLPITFRHVSELEALPLIHKDPFDRMLVAQCKSEGLVLVSRDPQMKAYGIMILEA